MYPTAGKINGQGFFIYEKGSKPRPNPSVLPLIEESRRRTNLMPGGKVSGMVYCVYENQLVK